MTTEPNDNKDGLSVDGDADRVGFEPVKKAGKPKGRGGFKLFVILVLLTAVVAGGGWFYFGDKMDEPGMTAADKMPVVRAEEDPIKVRPKDPGGMAIPDRDKLVYERLNGTESQPKVERLLPDPEEPQAPPMPDVGSDTTKTDSAADTPKPTMPEPVEASEVAKEAPIVDDQTTKEAATTDPVGNKIAEALEDAPKAPSADEVAAIAPPPSAPEAKTPMTEAPVAQTSGYQVQLGALRTEERATAAWRGLVKKHDALLGGLSHDIVRADLGTKGIFYRLRAGPFANKTDASALCDKLKEQKVGCLPVKAGS